jgi:fatty acid-binding protein DegV
VTAGQVAVVTDSAASLDPAVAAAVIPEPLRQPSASPGPGSGGPEPGRPAADAGGDLVIVVPLRVLAGPAAADDAPGPLAGPIAAELARGERLSTSRPAPERFAAAYAAAAAAGAPAVVSVHLSGELSGTIGAARLAAAGAPVPVHVVDSRSIGAGLGVVVRAAVLAAAGGGSGEQVAQAAVSRAGRLGSFFALDSQEQLRAGGRLSGPPGAGPAPAGLAGPAGMTGPGAAPGGGSLLRSRPLLQVTGGRIVVLERVRTRAAVLERLTELAAGYAAGRTAELAVQHIANPVGADELRRRLARVITAAGPVSVTEAGAAILAHAGPGLLAVVVAPVAP